jgi:hypothetical protein
MSFEKWLVETRPEAVDGEIELFKNAYKSGKLEAAIKILEMWNEPWPITQKPFIDNLKAYIEELKK